MGVVLYKTMAVLAVAAGILAGPHAFASNGTHKQKCKTAADDAKKACDQAANQAKAQDQAHNAGGNAQDQGHGGHNDRGTGNLCPRLQNQKQNLDTAKGTCETAKQTCNTKCGAEMQAWGQPHNPPNSNGPKPEPEKCGANTDPQIAQLGSAAAPLAQQAGEACKSGDQAKNGNMPQIPPMQPPQDKDDKKEEEKKKEVLKCEAGEGYRYSDCNNNYIGSCTTSNMSGANCNEFASRYCGSATSGSQSELVAAGTNAAVVVDKGGEGLGSSFCKMYQAYKFCQAGRGAECPSCRGTYSYNDPNCQNNAAKCMSSADLKEAQNKCPTDPVFLDPSVQKQLAEAKKDPEKIAESKPPPTVAPGGTTGGAGGGSGGGSGSGLGGGGGTGASGINGATPESLPAGTAVNSDPGGGGGGGGGGGNYNYEPFEEDERKPSGALSAQSAESGGAAQSMPPDISNQYGPNVFSISTTVYRSMCTRGSLTRCNRRR